MEWNGERNKRVFSRQDQWDSDYHEGSGWKEEWWIKKQWIGGNHCPNVSIRERNSKTKKAVLKEQNVCMLDVEGSVVYEDLVQADEEWRNSWVVVGTSQRIQSELLVTWLLKVPWMIIVWVWRKNINQMISSSVNEREMVKKSKEHIECLRVGVGGSSKKHLLLNKSVRGASWAIITNGKKGDICPEILEEGNKALF